MTDTSIASAIAVAEPLETGMAENNTLKRRHSEAAEAEHESKRQRTSPGKNSPTRARDDADDGAPKEEAATQEQPNIDQRGARRKSSIADEKQRSKRLFGALLGSLNQPGDRTTKRRQEIESRRKAELQRQDDERVEDKLRRQEKLAERRRIEQQKVDEQNMRTRHSNLLHTANFLQTTAEPRLYYRPWDLRSDEEDRIDAQIKEAQAQIDRDLDRLEHGHRTNGKGDIEDNQERSPTQKRTELPELRPTGQQQSPSHSIHESSKQAAGEAVEEQALAKSEDSKPDEVPDSEATNHDTNDNDTPYPKNGEEGHDELKTEEQAQGNAGVEEDEGDVVN